MKKLIYTAIAVLAAVPVVAFAQGACGGSSPNGDKGDKDMAEAKEHMKKGAEAAKDAAAKKMEQGKEAVKDTYEKSKDAVKDTYQDSKDAMQHAADRMGYKAEAAKDAARDA